MDRWLHSDFKNVSLPTSVFGYDINIRVVDDLGRSVADAEATIAFIGYIQGSGETFEGTTDERGMFRAEGRAEHSVFVVANKSGHYEARVGGLPKDEDIEMGVVIPRIRNPIPLYAGDVILTFPAQGEWLGFDFEAGDWVAPYGLGESEDIRFRFENTFIGYQDAFWDTEKAIDFSKRAFAARDEEWTIEKFKLRAGKWDASLEIAFLGEAEGMYEETRFLEYSRLKLPHEAPDEGYVPTWYYTANTYSPPTTRNEMGFYLRTRVRLDQNGDIASAHYAKVMGNFSLDARGQVRFRYHFNPEPNDRNLELDPTKNLQPECSWKKVYDP